MGIWNLKAVQDALYSPGIITDGLALYLDAGVAASYPGSGTSWIDLSGNGNNGTLTNGPTFNSDGGGNFLFSGTSNKIDVLSSSSLNFTGELTLSSWFRFSSLPSGELPFIRKDGPAQWQLGFAGSTTIRCLVATNGTTGWTAGNDVSFTPSLNTWYNMVMTYNGSNMLIYMNNSLIKTATVTGTINTGAGNIWIGYFSTVFLQGNLSNCMIYNRALTAEEITSNYNAFLQRFI